METEARDGIDTWYLQAWCQTLNTNRKRKGTFMLYCLYLPLSKTVGMDLQTGILGGQAQKTKT